jgi:hypothetical protein
VNKTFGELLASRKFSMRDQELFARFSGDSNPVHVNPLEARRTIAGQCIVHGINSLLWAMDVLVHNKKIIVVAFEVKFLNSVFLEENVDCFWSVESKKLFLVSGTSLLCTIRITEGTVLKIEEFNIPIEKPSHSPAMISFSEASHLQKQPLIFHGDSNIAKQLYPAFCERYGLERACEIAMVSDIVGMQVPGLNSLFLAFSAEFRQENVEHVFSIAKHDSRFETLSLAIDSATFKGMAKVVFRPTIKPPLSMEQLSAFVEKDEFKNIKALIVGGSRGLGEVVAKLIACGGGHPVITYHSGASDARRVCEIIHAYGASCDTIQYTVGAESTNIYGATDINQCYFFATPKIFGKRSSDYDNQLVNLFTAVYVDGFGKLCRQLHQQTPFLTVMYPSSVAIDNPLPGLAEYIDAKLKGEEFCKVLSRQENTYVVWPRLPRIETDQTLSLIKVPASDPVEILLPIIRQMTEENNLHV